MEHLIDAYSPAEMARRVLKVGVAKAKLPVAVNALPCEVRSDAIAEEIRA